MRKKEHRLESRAIALLSSVPPHTTSLWSELSESERNQFREAAKHWELADTVKPDYWHVYDLVDQALCDEETRAGQCSAATNEILRYFGHSDLVEIEEYMNRVVDLVWPGESPIDFEAFDNLRRAVKNGWIVLGDFKAPEGEE